MTTSLTQDTNQLRKISGLPTELALPKAATFLSYLVKDLDFVNSRILPFLEEARYTEDWYVAHSHEAEDGSFSLQVFVWPPGTRTKIHDHSSWGAYCCAIGSVSEERYERLDDGSRPDHARLKKVWQLSWSSEDGASTVLPGDGGIHRVGNPGESTTISVHLYGPKIGEVDGRDYDPCNNYVCDRREA
jgi:predicted metal-dependent enzyme (double-stranded beta helix superfamily)